MTPHEARVEDARYSGAKRAGISPLRLLRVLLLIAFVAWLPLAALNIHGQRCLFSASGDIWQSDFWMPRITAELGYSAAPTAEILSLAKTKNTWPDPVLAVKLNDRCYPPAGMLPLKAFPLSQGGADAWTVIGPVVYLLLCALAVGWRKAGLFIVASPFLFNFGQANAIWLPAGAVALFLAHYRSPVRARRVLAAVSLGVAASMKLSPAVLGLLYLPELFGGEGAPGGRRLRLGTLGEIGLAAGTFVVLFLAPFAAMPEGFAGLSQMFANAAANGRFYGARAAFGFGALYRSFLIVTQGGWSADDAVLRTFQQIGQAFGFLALVVGAWRRDRVLTVAAMLLAFPNQMFYTLLYLLPALALEAEALDGRTRGNWMKAAALFMMLCPLQLTVCRGADPLSANPTLANLGLIALVIGLLPRLRDKRKTGW